MYTRILLVASCWNYAGSHGSMACSKAHWQPSVASRRRLVVKCSCCARVGLLVVHVVLDTAVRSRTTSRLVACMAGASELLARTPRRRLAHLVSLHWLMVARCFHLASMPTTTTTFHAITKIEDSAVRAMTGGAASAVRAKGAENVACSPQLLKQGTASTHEHP